MTTILYENGRISPDDLGDSQSVCKLRVPVADAINHAYAALSKDRFSRWSKETGAEDFSLIGKMIAEARDTDNREKCQIDSLSVSLENALLEAGFCDMTVRVYGQRRRHFIIACDDKDGTKITSPNLREVIESHSGTKLGAGQFYRKGRMALMECDAKNRYRTQYAVASAAGGRDRVSGDFSTSVTTADGYFYSIISDGMGSGEEARQTSSFVCQLLEGALGAGTSKITLLKIINHILMRRASDYSATLDMFSMDLISAEAQFVKCGAASSFIRRGSSVFRIRSRTVPLGLMKEIDAEKIKVEIQAEDFIIMLSDGVLGSDAEALWLLDALVHPPSDDPRAYADFLLEKARKHSDSDDDMMVAVIKIIEDN